MITNGEILFTLLIDKVIKNTKITKDYVQMSTGTITLSQNNAQNRFKKQQQRNNNQLE